jgi:hypothetical protein
MISQPISFILRYDRFTQNISASFSINLEELTDYERQPMEMMANEFLKISQEFINQKIDSRMLWNFSWLVKNALEHVKQETGVEMGLDDRGLQL